VKQRLAFRFEFSSDQEKEIRTLLGEQNEEFITKISETYQDLKKRKEILFSDVIDTTSTKQSTAALLRLFGLGFQQNLLDTK